MTKQIAIVVSPKGEIQCIYQEELDLSPLGTQVIKRASHVEPTAGLSGYAARTLMEQIGEMWTDCTLRCQSHLKSLYSHSWWSDLTPSGGPVLGPFAKRSQALEAEAAWLQKNVLLKQKEST